MTDDGTLTTDQVAELARVSYRQLDSWVRLGYLLIADAHPGHGNVRRWSPDEVEQARVLASLVDVGLMPAAAAKALPTRKLHGDAVRVTLTRRAWIRAALT